MITIQAFTERMRGIVTRVELLRETKQNGKALEVLDAAKDEIVAQKKVFRVWTPELVKVECDIYRHALDLVWSGVQ